MIMKTLFTFIFIIISPNIFASNIKEWNKWMNESRKPIDGEMKCKITDQIVLQVKDGKPERFTGITNQPKIGDTLNFTYSSYNERIKTVLKNPQKEYLNTQIPAVKGNGVKSKIIRFEKDTIGHKSLYMTEDVIGLDYSIFGLNNHLNMKRYYKTDWEGIFTDIYETQTIIITLDCRHQTDKIGEMINLYKKYPGKLKIKK